MPEKKASKAVKMTDADARQRVEAYLLQQNRPYSITDVHMNLKGVVGKTQMTKAFDALDAEGKIVVKLYGKQKVFLIHQDNFPDLDEEEDQRADEELKTLEQELVKETAGERQETQKLASLKGSLTTPNLKATIDELVTSNESKEKKLEVLCSGTVLISEEERVVIKKKYVASVKSWKRRKRTASDMLDVLSEGMNEKPKKLCEMIGVETDEEMNVTIKDFPL